MTKTLDWIASKEALAEAAADAGTVLVIRAKDTTEAGRKLIADFIADSRTSLPAALAALRIACEALSYSICDCYVHEQKHRPECEEARNANALSAIERALGVGK